MEPKMEDQFFRKSPYLSRGMATSKIRPSMGTGSAKKLGLLSSTYQEYLFKSKKFSNHVAKLSSKTRV